MRQEYDRYTTAGLEIIAIGMGSPRRTAAFRRELKLPFPMLSDPRRVSYRAYGLLKMSLRREASIASAMHFARNVARHGGAREPDQNMLQLGGVFVVDQQGIVRYAFRSARAHEYPTVEQLIRVAPHLPTPQVEPAMWAGAE
jgi:peroxiredoxin